MSPDEKREVFRTNLQTAVDIKRLEQRSFTLKTLADSLGWETKKYDWLRRIHSSGLCHVSKKNAADLDHLAIALGMRDRSAFWDEFEFWSSESSHKPDGYSLGMLAAIGAVVVSRHPKEGRKPEGILGAAYSASARMDARQIDTVFEFIKQCVPGFEKLSY